MKKPLTILLPPELKDRVYKFCPDCNQDKLTTSFARNRSEHDGLAGICKKCSSDRYHQWYKKNRIRENKKKVEYNKLHRKKINVSARKYHAEHKEEIHKKAKKYREEHKEEIRLYKKEYRRKNKIHFREVYKQRYIKRLLNQTTDRGFS